SLNDGQLARRGVAIADGRMHVRVEGRARAVEAQLRAIGGDEAEPWGELRALQARLPGRVRWDAQAAGLVRPGPRFAYVEQAREPVWSPLAERVLEAMCSPS